jgi:hypothetical protein
MTAQSGERLFYNGEARRMAAEPLNQYLQKRSDIKFIAPSTACWRGYYGQWEIQNNKLYLISLKAYLVGYKEVYLSYIFPGQTQVLADWFCGKIKIPQGEMLEYVHMGYASLFEKDLILEIENGVLVDEYVVDNEKEFQETLKHRAQQKADRFETQAKIKKNEKVASIIVGIVITVLLTATIFVITKLISSQSTLGYLTSIIITIPLLFILIGTIFYFYKKENMNEQDKAIKFIGINLLVILFIGICIGVFFLINLGTILGYLISTAMLGGSIFLAFLAIKNSGKQR